MEKNKLLLLRLDGESTQEIQIEKDETLLGRGSFLSIGDKKVSRNHATLSYSQGTCSLKSIHVNPCFVKLKSGKCLVLKNGGSVNLTNGDEFSLLQDKYRFSVQFHCKDMPTGVNNVVEPSDTNMNNGIVSFVERTCQTSLVDNTSEKRNESPRKLVKIFPTSKSSKTVNLEDEPMGKKKRKLPAWMTSPTKSLNNQASSSKKTKESIVEHNLNDITSMDLKAEGDCKFKQNNDHVQDFDFEKKEVKVKVISNKEIVQDTNKESNTDTASLQNISSSPIGFEEDNNSYDDNNVTSDIDAKSGLPQHSQSDLPSPNKSNSFSEKYEGNTEKDGGMHTGDNIADQPSVKSIETSSPPTSTRSRDLCAYGKTCYRKNPLHFQEFCHPGDADYVSPPASGDEDDDRPECEYGLQCYRKNPVHRCEYKHTRRVAPQRTVTKTKTRKSNDGSDEDDYDVDDSFIDDDESEEEDSLNEDSEWKPSQDTKKSHKKDVDSTSESDDIDALVSDANKFATNKKMWKK